MQSLKDQILKSEDIKHKDVPVPEWGGVVVRVKGLSSRQLAEYQAKSAAIRAHASSEYLDVQQNVRHAEIVAKCLYDPETGQRIFSDAEAPRLAEKNGGVVAALFKLVNKLSGTDRTFEQQVKDAEGNSESVQS